MDKLFCRSDIKINEPFHDSVHGTFESIEFENLSENQSNFQSLSKSQIL